MQASRPVHQTAVSLLPSLFGGGGGGEGCGGSQKLACIKPCGEMEWEWGWCINIIDGPVQNWMAVISLVLMGASCPVLTSWHGGTFPCLNRCSYWPYAPHWTTWAYSWAMLRGHVRWEGFFFFLFVFFSSSVSDSHSVSVFIRCFPLLFYYHKCSTLLFNLMSSNFCLAPPRLRTASLQKLESTAPILCVRAPSVRSINNFDDVYEN